MTVYCFESPGQSGKSDIVGMFLGEMSEEWIHQVCRVSPRCKIGLRDYGIIIELRDRILELGLIVLMRLIISLIIVLVVMEMIDWRVVWKLLCVHHLVLMMTSKLLILHI